MELYKFHIFDRSLGTVYHSYTIAGGYKRIGCCLVYGANAAGSHDSYACKEFFNLACLLVQYICSIASYVRSSACHYASQMVLGDDFYGKMMLVDVYIGVMSHCLYKTALYFESGVVGVMQYSEFAMSTLAVQVKRPVFATVKVHTPRQQIFDTLGRSGDHGAYCCRVGEPVSGYHSIMYVFLEVVHGKIGHRSDPALCQCSVGLIESSLAYQSYTTVLSHFKGKTHAGYTGAYDQIIVFHIIIYFARGVIR